jgi:hypothetical protein
MERITALLAKSGQLVFLSLMNKSRKVCKCQHLPVASTVSVCVKIIVLPVRLYFKKSVYFFLPITILGYKTA